MNISVFIWADFCKLPSSWAETVIDELIVRIDLANKCRLTSEMQNPAEATILSARSAQVVIQNRRRGFSFPVRLSCPQVELAAENVFCVSSQFFTTRSSVAD